MKAFDINSTVYVAWYGNVLQGRVVTNPTPQDALLGSMVAVQTTIQGTKVVTLFTPGHVYDSLDAVPVTCRSVCSNVIDAPIPQTSPPVERPVDSPKDDNATLIAHRQHYKEFKAAHWDNEHNRLQIDALEEFYAIFREGVAMKLRMLNKDVPSPSPRHTVSSASHVTVARQPLHNPKPKQLSLF